MPGKSPKGSALILFTYLFCCAEKHLASYFSNQGSNPHSPSKSPNHWTTREVPSLPRCSSRLDWHHRVKPRGPPRSPILAAISTDPPPCPRNKPKKLINLPASHRVLQGWVELPVLKGISLHISDTRVESLQLSRLRVVKVILCVPAS